MANERREIMTTIEFIHGRLALSAVLFSLIMGLWAAWSYFRKQGVNSNYLGALVIGEILMMGQGILGALMVIGGVMPGNLVHFLYGFLVALCWPGVYVYTHGRTGRAEAAIYALVSLAIFGLALRAITTGSGAP
jgi:hypothetical protein